MIEEGKKIIKINKSIKKVKKARKIKIKIKTEEGKRITIPSIPFSFIELFAGVIIFFMRFDKRMKLISTQDIIEIIDELRYQEPFRLIELKNNKGVEVDVYTI